MHFPLAFFHLLTPGSLVLPQAPCQLRVMKAMKEVAKYIEKEGAGKGDHGTLMEPSLGGEKRIRQWG